QQSFSSPQPPQKQLSYLEEALTKLALNTNSFMDETRANFRNQEASIRNLEVQVGQMAKQLNQITEKSPNILPSDTVINPRQKCRQECKAIQVIEVKEAQEVHVEAPKEEPEIIAKIKSQEDDHHPPQSSKKHTRSS
ncbi:hypothetical protein PIB30_102242, partial [Stylosanthes scabra]|nr:hypothetical protein [Stylosanthes scabra]